MADLCRCIVEQAVPEAMRSVILADARAFLSTYPADQRNRMNLRHFERHPGAPEPMGIFGLPVTVHATSASVFTDRLRDQRQMQPGCELHPRANTAASR
jgi:hypothetical protein